MPEGDELACLRAENARLERMVEVLMERAEQDQGHQSDYALFETAAVLEDTVKARTTELVEANRRLTDEIARRRSAEEELQRAKARAEHASENKSSFLTAVSHDLQQPLTAARLLLQAIADSANDDDVLDLAATGQATLETMESLLGSLIDIAKLDSGVIQPEPTHFRLDALLHRLGSEYRLHAESADLECRVHCPPAAVVHSDSVLVERIVRNLLGNAVRYTRSGGLLLGARRHADQWCVVVHDTGVGIPMEEQQRIFRSFYRLPQSRNSGSQGLGLGLTIVHMIADLLATHVRLRSKPGRGSTFSLALPVGNAALVPFNTTAPVATTAAGDLRGQEVLVVENDPAVVTGLFVLLRQWGARVQTFEQPPHSLDATPEAALIDYHLGVGSDNGLAYAARLRDEYPQMTLVMITSERGEWLVTQCQRLGIDVLHKPVDTDRLRELLPTRCAR